MQLKWERQLLTKQNRKAHNDNVWNMFMPLHCIGCCSNALFFIDYLYLPQSNKIHNWKILWTVRIFGDLKVNYKYLYLIILFNHLKIPFFNYNSIIDLPFKYRHMVFLWAWEKSCTVLFNNHKNLHLYLSLPVSMDSLTYLQELSQAICHSLWIQHSVVWIAWAEPWEASSHNLLHIYAFIYQCGLSLHSNCSQLVDGSDFQWFVVEPRWKAGYKCFNEINK